MPDKKQERFSPPAVGGTSLLVVFAVLCLTVFALLSLSTVRASQRLSETSAQAVADYYAADCQAQAVLAWLRTGGGQPEGLPGDFSVRTAISDYGDYSETTHSYACPISDTQELQVELTLDARGRYTILRWQSVPTGDWEYDDSLTLWDGDIVVIE